VTIDRRIDDAEFLWRAGRHEGALLSALVAFAATSRRVRPKQQEKYDAVAFKKLFQEQLPSGWSVTFRGELTSMDVLFYKWLRCELVHAGGLPIGLSFDPTDESGIFTMALRDDLPIAVSTAWYHSLVLSVIGHPINADIFPNQEERVAAAIERHRATGQRLIGMSCGNAEGHAHALQNETAIEINFSKNDCN